MNHKSTLLKLKTTLFLLLVTITSLSAQVTTEGRDFWFGFMDNDNVELIEVYVSAKEAASITLSAPLANYQVNATISANTTRKLIVPLNLMPTTEGIQQMGLHLTSNSDVSVYTLNKRRFSADAAVILPTAILGQEYYVIAHREPPGEGTGNDLESELLVVATSDDTKIEITPSVATFGGWPAGETREITLNAGQTYQLKSNQDLTGTYVLNVSPVDPNVDTCKKIAVFGGNKFTNVGGCGGNHDHLIEQMFPVPTWGKKFLFVPYETRTGGDLVKIIASEDNTRVEITGRLPVTMSRGQVMVIKALAGVRSIDSDKPIQIAQFSRSTQCDGANGDPFMIMLSPLEQRVEEVTFNAFVVTEINQYYLTLVTGKDDLQDITVDGNDVSSQFTVVGDGAYLNLQITQGTHSLKAPGGVIAYVYGYGPSESFGYSAGVSLEVLNLEIEGDDSQIGIIAEEGCINSEISFDVLFETPVGEQPRYDTFDWDFGNLQVASGRQVTHTFTEAGTYTVTLTASKGVAACSNSETITREIIISDIDVGEITGPISVCPDVTGVQYSTSGPGENSYEWFVSGGTIAGSSTGQSIAIDWGASRDDAWVKLLVKNHLGCAADTLQMDVKINKRLEPALPTGDVEVCFLDLGSVTYSTPITNGSEYEWFISNGTILTDNTLNTIDVMWDGAGTGQVWYREHNPLITDCEGFSDRLDVIIYTEIQPTETITDALCNGDANGTIGLSVVGGKGAYTVVWSNGMTGMDISGLAVGTYTATISDELGCEITRDYVVGEPDVLSVDNFTILDVRCFQESNGEISLTAIGGTAPYSYHFTGNGFDQNGTSASLTGLPTGDYNIEITDANGCMTSVTYFVAEPPLLEPDLEKLINMPICPQASDGIVSIDAKGGTPAYQFFWNTAPPQEGMEANGLARGLYTVTIIDANGCEATLDVEVTERFPRVFIPSAFSPNTDGENDEFVAVTDCTLLYSMQVFNKWGTIIFSTNDIKDGWDGTFDGQNVPDGNYTYKVFYSGSVNGIPFEETVRGTVRVFR